MVAFVWILINLLFIVPLTFWTQLEITEWASYSKGVYNPLNWWLALLITVALYFVRPWILVVLLAISMIARFVFI